MVFCVCEGVGVGVGWCKGMSVMKHISVFQRNQEII